MNRKPTFGTKPLRMAAVTVGLAILLWSGLEDRNAAAVSLLGALSSVVLTLWLYTRLAAGHSVRGIDLALVGAITGALSALSTAALMLFKNLRHTHPFPDYPAEMMLAILQRLPIWSIAGGLAGLGIGLLLASRSCENDSDILPK